MILVRTPEANPRIGNLFRRTSPLHGGAHLLLVVVLGIFLCSFIDPSVDG